MAAEKYLTGVKHPLFILKYTSLAVKPIDLAKKLWYNKDNDETLGEIMILNDWKRNIAYITESFEEMSFEASGAFEITKKDEVVNENITKHTLTYRNNGKKTRIIPVFQTVTAGAPDFYMIPCVNYNGNEWGTCQEPKGYEVDGQPWIFSSDRIGIPGCSIAELGERCVGIFAGNDENSLNSSASLFVREGNTVQRIYFSHVEYPTVFVLKYVYDPAIINFIAFEQGEEKTFVCYSYNKAKNGEKFAYYGILDFLNMSYVRMLDEKFKAKDCADYTFEFIHSLLEEKEFGILSNMGFLPDENGVFQFRKEYRYEIGWCGQNGTIAEMHIRKYMETGEKSYLDIGKRMLDTWLLRQHDSGIISASYDPDFDDKEKIDTCNEGWCLIKLIVCCELLKSLGENVERYENAARGVAGHYINYFPNGGFPQISNPKGEIVTNEGCAGAMLMLGYIFAYKYFGAESYLARAVSAFDFYYGTYLSNSIAAGGALDTYCIDKESAGPVLRSAIMLYELTKDEKYLAYAKNTAYYLMTWTYYHDVPFPKGSDCERMGVRTTGGTSVSTAHHHLDVWGVYYAPDMMKLYEFTGNEAFLEQAKLLWLFTLQYMSDGKLTLHGMTRGAGAENEAVLHCNWNWSADGKKGELNDWLVSWVATFKLDAYYALKDKGFFERL